MPRDFFRRWMPHPHKVHGNKILRVFGKALHQPNLWHLNRHSVARAVALGLFWTFVPMPFQMIPATACALLLRANIGITLVLVWITNPLTLPPVLYVSYRFGRIILGLPPRNDGFEFTWASVRQHWGDIWQPLLVGGITAGVLLGLIGYLAVQWTWRWNVSRRWRKRGHRCREPIAHDPNG